MLFLYLVLFFSILIYYFTKTRRALHMLQQNLYNENNRYIKWISRNLKTVFGHIDVLGILFIIPLFFIENNILRNIWLIGLIAFYLLNEYVILMIAKSDQNKKPLVTTSRIKRLWTTLFLIYFIPVVIGSHALLKHFCISQHSTWCPQPEETEEQKKEK